MRLPLEEQIRRTLDEELVESEKDLDYITSEQPEFDWLNEEKEGETYLCEVRDEEVIEEGRVYRLYRGRVDERHPDVELDDFMANVDAELMYGPWFVATSEPYMPEEGPDVPAIDIEYKKSGEEDTLLLDDAGILPYSDGKEEYYHRFNALQENVLAWELQPDEE